jgi:hypothetical protein
MLALIQDFRGLIQCLQANINSICLLVIVLLPLVAIFALRHSIAGVAI